MFSLYTPSMNNRILFLFSIAVIITLQACRAEGHDAIRECVMLKTDHLSYTDYSTQIEGIIIENEDFNTYLIRNNLEDKPILVLSYSINDCKSCLDNVIKEMTVHIPDLNKNQRVLFIASDARVSYEPEYGNTLILKYSDYLDIPKNITPLLFIYDGCIRHCFFPTGLFKESFYLYLDNIARRYQLN